MRLTGHVLSYKAWCSAVITCFFNSSDWCISILAVHSVIFSLGAPLSHGSPVVVFLILGIHASGILFHYPCWCCSGEVRAVEKSTNHSRASCFIRLHMTSRPHRLKKTKNMQSKHRDLHHMWLHRETNEKLSFHSIFTGCCNSNAENNPSGSTWQNPQEA